MINVLSSVVVVVVAVFFRVRNREDSWSGNFGVKINLVSVRVSQIVGAIASLERKDSHSSRVIISTLLETGGPF